MREYESAKQASRDIKNAVHRTCIKCHERMEAVDRKLANKLVKG